MQVTTESGAVYQFTKDGGKFRRLTKRNDIDPLAEVDRPKQDDDGTWLPIFDMTEPKLGEHMNLMVSEEAGTISVRQTSAVIGIEQ
mgnify:CR=1 FL=1